MTVAGIAEPILNADETLGSAAQEQPAWVPSALAQLFSAQLCETKRAAQCGSEPRDVAVAAQRAWDAAVPHASVVSSE